MCVNFMRITQKKLLGQSKPDVVGIEILTAIVVKVAIFWNS
jgi:hypothetical protein